MCIRMRANALRMRAVCGNLPLKILATRLIIYLKRLKPSKFVRVKAFPMYGGIGVSASSLHRESTDSLI